MRHSSLILVCVGCCQALLTPKQTSYTIGGWISSPEATFLSKWRPVLETYLTQEVGPLYDPAISFKLVPFDYSGTNAPDVMIAAGKLDFAYHVGGGIACLEAQYGYTTIATQVQVTLGKEVSSYGSVIYSLKANTKIKSMDDFEGTPKVSRMALLNVADCCHRIEQYLDAHGLNIYTGFSQVVFYLYDYPAMMNGIIMGQIDVAVIQSGWLETNYPQNVPLFTFHNVVNVTYQATPYPFPTTTGLVPTYGLMAAPHIPLVLMNQVFDALSRLNKTHPAAKAAGIVNFGMPGSYEYPRMLVEQLGMLVKVPGGGHSRVDIFQGLENFIICPAGYVLEEGPALAEGCRTAGLTCPDGFQCFCSPCHPDIRVNIFPWQFVLGLCCTLFATGLCFSVGWSTALISGDLARRLRRRIIDARKWSEAAAARGVRAAGRAGGGFGGGGDSDGDGGSDSDGEGIGGGGGGRARTEKERYRRASVERIDV